MESGGHAGTPDIHGAYPVHYAAQMCGSGNDMGTDLRTGLTVLRRLLAHNVRVDVQDRDGRKPLMWAASAGSTDALVTLVNAGASVAAVDKDGLTALHCAASRGHHDCVETLTTLCGAEVDAVDNNSCTPLFYSVTLGHADCADFLVSAGADAMKQDRKGRSSAHCGAAKGQLSTLKARIGLCPEHFYTFSFFRFSTKRTRTASGYTMPGETSRCTRLSTPAGRNSYAGCSPSAPRPPTRSTTTAALQCTSRPSTTTSKCAKYVVEFLVRRVPGIHSERKSAPTYSIILLLKDTPNLISCPYTTHPGTLHEPPN